MKRIICILSIPFISVLSCMIINAQDAYHERPDFSPAQLRGNKFWSDNSFGLVMPSHAQTIKAKDYIKNSKNNLDGYPMSMAQMLANEASEDSALIYTWDTDWELSFRNYYYLNATSVEIFQEKLNPDGAWNNYYKRVLEYYSTGTFRRETESFWKNSSSDWKIAFLEEFNTYGENTEAYSRTWNDTTQEFTEGFRVISSYVKDTLLKSEIYQEWDIISKGWKNLVRIDNDYNANDLVSKTLESEWKEGNWSNSYSMEYGYNEFGDLETQTAREWDTVSLAWINDFMTERRYNSLGIITTIVRKDWDTVTSDWVDEFQQLISYDDFFQVQSVLAQTWNGNLWIDSLRSTYEYTAEGRISQFLEEIWDVSDWIGVYREDYTYGSTAITIEIDEWNKNSNAWENQVLITYFFNELGNFMLEQREYWNSQESAYETGYYDKYDNDGTNPEYYSKTWNDTLNEFTGGIRILTTYYDDANRSILQRIIQEWDTLASDWLNFQKTVFFWAAVSVEPNHLSGSYKIFPSPFSSVINVEKDDDPGSIPVIRIFDLTGKLVHQSELADRMTTLDLSFLESGVYLAEIGALKSRTVIKLVKH